MIPIQWARRLRVPVAPQIVLAVVAAALVDGCAARAPRLNLDEGMSWAEVCARLRSRWRSFGSVEAKVRYAAESAWGNLSGYGRLAYDVTARAAVLELRGPLGIRALALFAVGDSLWAYVPMQNAVYYFPSGTENAELDVWRRLIGETILGRPPLDCQRDADVTKYGPSRLSVWSELGGRPVALLLDREWGDLVRARLYWGENELVLEYDGYRASHNLRLPGLVRLRSDRPLARIAVSFLETHVNAPIRWERYRIRVPSSAKRVPLTRLLAQETPANGGLTVGAFRGHP